MTDINPNGVLHPYPRKIDWNEGYLKIKGHVSLIIPSDLSSETVELFLSTWESYTQSKIKLNIISSSNSERNTFLLSTGIKLPANAKLKRGYQSALIINRNGVSASGNSETTLKHCWFSILQLLVAGRTPEVKFYLLPFLAMHDSPRLKFRSIHLCVFPETTLGFLEKVIKLTAFMKFSHIIIEFWGTLKYESLPELSWPQAYTKKQIHQVLQLARQMGIQPVPMFNHWGHAAASRDRIGRHVVLDQNPALESLFEADGWTWCLKNPTSLNLLKNIRAELMELFFDTDYFHLGCDEAYSHGTCPECRKYNPGELWAEYLNSVNNHLKTYNVRPIIWGDGLLEKSKWKGYIASSSKGRKTHEAINVLSTDFIISDWQYGIHDKEKAATVEYFMQKGFDVITAPYSSPDNILTMANIAIEKNIMGMLLTTWNTLPLTMKVLPLTIGAMWNGTEIIHKLTQYEDGYLTTVLSTYLRKLRGKSADFKNAGWRSYEVTDMSNF